ncbi:hypothetical protein INR75_14055 [Zunongwangia sp. SCSIO 43204]|uniref:hypothetical protein n=1 Tax=Zunongwangia sp. SCSIO 43204 TaxID=2779359 RepID=UPI001CA8185A|nr:hypothetical protein [Zunongwangia sp. SCSIO 43204]UAB83301.1 hypothetical protein INR75_14055 [Zunongwangia sp. SCSIO 43204]
MKNKLLLFAFLFSLSFYGQKKFEPQILILTPFSVKSDKDFNREITEINDRIKENQNSEQGPEYLNSPDFKNQPENIQKMIKSEFEFSKNLNIYSNVSYISEQFLAYKFFEKFPNLLISL